MDVGLGSYGLALVAGVLSTLSPCVLPILPIVIGSSVAVHRYGAIAIALGMALSFAVVGTLLASVGARLGLQQDAFRNIAAVIMLVFGVILVSTHLQQKFANSISGLSGIGNQLLSKVSINGLHGQFVIGLMLGLIWSPCVGPTLGAAITLASQGQSLVGTTFVMLLFGIGAGLPIVLLGLLSRQAMMKMKVKLQQAGSLGKYLLGSVLILVSVMILTGWDKTVEIFLTKHSPEWLIQLTTSF